MHFFSIFTRRHLARLSNIDKSPSPSNSTKNFFRLSLRVPPEAIYKILIFVVVMTLKFRRQNTLDPTSPSFE